MERTSNEIYTLINNSDYIELVNRKDLLSGYLIDELYLKSIHFLQVSRKANLFLTLILIVFGLIGHMLTIFVFIQKRFRKNSSNVYFLCLAVNDSVYLVIHFFKDSIRNYQSIYLTDDTNSTSSFINFINLIDQFDFACKLMNYMRNVLRLISAYIIVAFTVQRLFLVYSPLSNNFKSKSSAWLTVAIIVAVSLIVNLWVPLIFEKNSICDVHQGWHELYFHITLVYICLIMLIPIVIIHFSNLIIIKKVYNKSQSDILNNKILVTSANRYSNSIPYNNNKLSHYLSQSIEQTHNKSSSKKLKYKRFKFKPYYLSMNQIISRVTHKANNSKRITKMLVLISFSYAALNLPYLIAWLCFYYKEVISQTSDITQHNYIYSLVKITELFFVLNYGICFYVNFATGSLFRNQLKYSSKKFFSYLKIDLILTEILNFFKLFQVELTRILIILEWSFMLKIKNLLMDRFKLIKLF